MADNDELRISIEQYEQQLSQVEEALKKTLDEQERLSLQSLRSDLRELVDLTKQTLNQTNTCDFDDTNNASSTSSYDDEMALFMSEIKNLDSAATDTDRYDSDEQFDEKLRAIKDELEAMIGKKCSAPHEHAWGGKAYHNAIVCGLDDTQDFDLVNIKDFRLRILFTNPTHKEMVPCSYYLDGDCKFDSEKCHFSHGELVPFGELKDYSEPDFTKLQRNCIVLAKMQDKIWHKARVLCANFIEKNCRIRLDREKKEIDCNFEDLLPIFYDDDQSTSDSDSEFDDSSDGDEARQVRLIEQSLLTPAPDQALGEWEKHTRGIGSKLMGKMGYIVGTGLGSNGEGIIVPISAQILPPGCSLDHCMELREAANRDKDLFSVEKKLKRIKKKQEAVNIKSYERERSKTDMFSFLNDNILSNNSTKIDKSVEKSQPKFDLKTQTTKNLNVESLKVADEIRRTEREIQKVKDAMRRHTTGDMHKRLQGQLDIKNHELNSLKKFETSVTREQIARKHTDKLTVF